MYLIYIFQLQVFLFLRKSQLYTFQWKVTYYYTVEPLIKDPLGRKQFIMSRNDDFPEKKWQCDIEILCITKHD